MICKANLVFQVYLALTTFIAFHQFYPVLELVHKPSSKLTSYASCFSYIWNKGIYAVRNFSYSAAWKLHTVPSYFIHRQTIIELHDFLSVLFGAWKIILKCLDHPLGWSNIQMWGCYVGKSFVLTTRYVLFVSLYTCMQI